MKYEEWEISRYVWHHGVGHSRGSTVRETTKGEWKCWFCHAVLPSELKDVVLLAGNIIIPRYELDKL